MSEHTPLTEAEWNDILAALPESPETAEGWELSLVRRTVERILAARTSTATADTGLRERLLAAAIERAGSPVVPGCPGSIERAFWLRFATEVVALDATAAPTTDIGARE